MAEIINNQRPKYEDRRRKGTGFTNTQDILEANTGNRVGQAVTSGVQKDVQEVADAATSKYNKFKEESDKNRLLWGDTEDKGEAQKSAEGFIQDITSGNYNLTEDKSQEEQDLYEQKQRKLQDFTKGTYAGPKEMENTDQLQSKAKSLEALGRMGRGEQGRQQILGRTFGGNKYTTGQSRLDSLMLGKSDEGQQAIRDIVTKTNKLAGDISSKQDLSRNIAQDRQIEAREFADRFKGALRTGQEEIGQQLKQRVEEGTGSLAGVIQDEFARTGKVDPRLLQMLGVESGRLYGTNVEDFAGPEATIKTVATDEDVARLNALGQIMGESTNPVLTGDLSSVGTYSELTNEKLRDEILARQAEERKGYEDLQRNYGLLESDIIDNRNILDTFLNRQYLIGNPYTVNDGIYVMGGGDYSAKTGYEKEQELYSDLANRYGSTLAPHTAYTNMGDMMSANQTKFATDKSNIRDIIDNLSGYKTDESIYGESDYLSQMEARQKQEAINELINKYGSVADMGV